MTRLLKYIFLNTAALVCLYLWAFQGLTWAYNLVVVWSLIQCFGTGVCFIFMFLISCLKEFPKHSVLYDSSMKNILKSKNESRLPTWFDPSLDWAWFFTLSAMGHWWLAGFFFCGNIFGYLTRSIIKTYEEEIIIK